MGINVPIEKIINDLITEAEKLEKLGKLKERQRIAELIENFFGNGQYSLVAHALIKEIERAKSNS